MNMNVENIYQKALLSLPENENDREEQIDKFEAIVDSVEKIMEVDTSNIEEFEITSDINSSLREDKIEESVDREVIFENTNHREYGYFKLDNVLED